MVRVASILNLVKDDRWLGQGDGYRDEMRTYFIMDCQLQLMCGMCVLVHNSWRY